MAKSIFENPLAEVVRGAFREWGCKNTKYKATYKKLNTDCFQLIDVALGEIDTLAPGPLWTWYTRNHMRFYKMRNNDIRYTIELLQEFLSDYAHGRLRTATKSIIAGTNNNALGSKRGQYQSARSASDDKTQNKGLRTPAN